MLFTQEHEELRRTVRNFIEKEVNPFVPEWEAAGRFPIHDVFKKMGDLGLLGVTKPEEYGGMGLDFKTTMLITEAIGGAHAFSVSFSAHTGIGTLPILYYGNEEQKKKWIPGLASGELKGCYCLTEPSAGSDANSGKTKARLSEDGKHYIINGQKMWITNGGFADVMIVFAKIDEDEKLTAFIVDASGNLVSASQDGYSFRNDSQVPAYNCSYKTVRVLYNDTRSFSLSFPSNMHSDYSAALKFKRTYRSRRRPASILLDTRATPTTASLLWWITRKGSIGLGRRPTPTRTVSSGTSCWCRS